MSSLRKPLTNLLRGTEQIATPAYATEAHDKMLKRLAEYEADLDARVKENKPVIQQITDAKAKYEQANKDRKQAEKQAEKLQTAVDAAAPVHALRTEDHPAEYNSLLEALNETAHSNDPVITKAFHQVPQPYEHKENCNQCFKRAFAAASQLLQNFEYRSGAGVTAATNLIEANREREIPNAPANGSEDQIAEKVAAKLQASEAFADSLADKIAARLKG